jgi:hypothetical protein
VAVEEQLTMKVETNAKQPGKDSSFRGRAQRGTRNLPLDHEKQIPDRGFAASGMTKTNTGFRLAPE